MKSDKVIISRLYYEAKKRAKERNFEFTITKEDIVLPDVCPILGVKLESHDRVFGRNSYTLDRIDSTRGYVKGNVRVISWQANYIKSNLSLEQAENLLRYIKGEI